MHVVSPPKKWAGSWIAGISSDDRVAGNACLTSDCSTSKKAFAGTIKKGKLTWHPLAGPPGSFLCGAAGCDLANAVGRAGDITGEFANHAILWQLKSNNAYKARLLHETATRFTSSTGMTVDTFGDVAGTERDSTFDVGTLWLPNGKGVNLPACAKLLVLGGGTFERPFGMYSSGSSTKRSIQIVGQCLVESEPSHTLTHVPCVWSAKVRNGNVSVTQPTRLDGNVGTPGQAAAVNGKQWIAGNMGTTSPGDATLWVKHEPALLSSLVQNGAGWTLGVLTGMNKSGEITGTGMLNGQQRAFLLTQG